METNAVTVESLDRAPKIVLRGAEQDVADGAVQDLVSQLAISKVLAKIWGKGATY